VQYQNYPNPFNPVTRITYDISKSTHVCLKIYNIRGREIRTLVNEFQKPGKKTIVWDGLDDLGVKTTTGIYFYKIQTDFFYDSEKMILTR